MPDTPVDLAVDNPVETEVDLDTLEGIEETEVEGEAQEVNETEHDEHPRHTVKVDGEEYEVTLDELINGYQRQRDYTQKTQQLAAEKETIATYQALEQALLTDPQGTIEILNNLYGNGTANADSSESEILDPLEREVKELQRFRAQVEQERRQAQINSEVTSVLERYGDTETTQDELLQFAVQRGVGDLESAYKALAFDRIRTRENERLEQEKEKKVLRKRTAPPVEGGKGSPPSGSTTTGASKSMSLAEAFAAAKVDHGF